MPDLDKEAQKAAMKEAISEWMDLKWATFGKWTAKGIIAMVIAGVTYLFVITHGFKL